MLHRLPNSGIELLASFAEELAGVVDHFNEPRRAMLKPVAARRVGDEVHPWMGVGVQALLAVSRAYRHTGYAKYND